MKTAISLPDDIYEAAERLAKSLGKSRSALYAQAVADYLARHDADAVTEAMNRVCDGATEGGTDRFVARVARRRLERTEW